jgi:hypothetical protein
MLLHPHELLDLSEHVAYPDTVNITNGVTSMPIIIEYQEEQHIAIAKMVGNLAAEEIDTTLKGELAEFIKKYSPERVDIIFDVYQFEWDFQQFVKYLTLTAERRKTQGFPPNLVQHYVGRNQWLQNFRTWVGKKFGDTINTFGTLEDALHFIASEKQHSN